MRSPDMLIFMQMARDAATCMYDADIDPFSKQEAYATRNLRDRKLQPALLHFFWPDNYFKAISLPVAVGSQG
jgi:hypothetical protein